ncbi:DUF4062 domain-containing protein [Clostridium sp. KNHs205]|uniref:DUF4062 domain-containing protein n=1 Tax=Clostridium sp. KNHs205 TaxID=1449050 RepID=UPI00068B4085|nr:DUF4062 domain-containing protein [Clostridium sp. KNHs205]
MNKKLQVFISSTYVDLQEERQSAVQAILDAGHIPAGMELFRAGNNSQLEVVKKWIDESDVYMLILGGRYGSIEPVSQKSYTQLEYEYAISKGIPVFAVILSEKLLHKKAAMDTREEYFEKINCEKYSEFKELVLSKIVRFIDNIKDINIAVLSTLNDFEKNCNLKGWIKEEKEVIITDVLHKCYKCGKEEILPSSIDYEEQKGFDYLIKINQWHTVDAGEPGYGSVLDTFNLKFELCDECLEKFIDSFKFSNMIYGENYYDNENQT